jgi:DNA modification methylase
MQFDKNKSVFIHKWYPFVEGYSKEFIQSVINELDYVPELALDPFAGSGTTPLELQELGIRCYSCEVSPFMHKLASVKLENNYTKSGFEDALITVGQILQGKLLPIRSMMTLPEARTFQPKKGRKKWIFDRAVMNGILDIKYAISQLSKTIYQDLFSIALASILLDVSNAYRDGKSLKYKNNWQDTKLKRRDIHSKFLNKLNDTFLPDIELFENKKFEVENRDLCLKGDIREVINKIPDNSIDLVITSPPYLNSRDYTDIYIAELWMLDLVKGYEDLRNLRKRTLRSHVQVKHGDVQIIDSSELKKVVSELKENEKDHWNSELLGMIKGYFADMDLFFHSLSKKMKPNKKIFFNVANSAYYGIKIKVDEIVAEIAENNGFKIEEIRKARDLNPSSQQKDQIDSLRETVIVLTNL